MKRLVMAGAATAALMSVGLYAQGRNFSGTWTVDTEKTSASNPAGGGGGRGGAVGATTTRSIDTGGVAGGGAARSGGGGGGGAVATRSAAGGGAAVGPIATTIAMDAKSFTVTQGQNATVYALDGSATDVSNARSRGTAKAAWQGDKLIIETTTEGPNGPMVSQAAWYLEGEWLVRENSSTGPDGQPFSRKTYFKKA